MNKKYDVTYYKEENGEKGFFKIIGIAFENDKGNITIQLDSLPLQSYWTDGRLILFPKKEH